MREAALLVMLAHLATQNPTPEAAIGPGQGSSNRWPTPEEVHAPRFLEAARKAHMRGTSVVHARLDPDASVHPTLVLPSFNPLMDGEVVRAASRWRFPSFNGAPREVALSFEFRIGSEAETIFVPPDRVVVVAEEYLVDTTRVVIGN